MSGTYAAFAGLWVLLSDRILWSLPLVERDQEMLAMGKGLLFVAITGVLLFSAILRVLDRQQHLVRNLRRSHRKYQALVEQSLAGICIVDAGRFVYVNPRFAEIFGYTREELLQAGTVMTVVAPEDRARVRANMRGGSERRHGFSFRGRRKDGRLMDAEVFGSRTELDGRPVVIGLLLDQTERDLLQRQTLHAQKLEVLGLVSSGVAHDFNNILTSISGFAQMLAGALAPGTTARQDAEDILRCSERAALLIRQLLGFSRPQTQEAGPMDLNGTIRGVDKMLQSAAGKRYGLDLDLAEDAGAVTAASGQIEQVLMNLVVNARDAMPDGGRIRVATRRRFVREKEGILPRVVLTVQDQGCGMDRETLARLSEPFFTTKAPGKGTGLGLCTIRRIANQAGGRLEIDSAPGRGTSVSLYLPPAAAPRAASATAVAAEVR